ncbi:kinase superfamily protein, putative [Medicago truncatula]|uniref:Kinase superfamily protein, putative n=1 Tax=Medicago truncatula TaxID=3880 RepID=A0A072U9X9_MEDTR|nr:kinase superfamily protein, putative [Medicago truncatula]
MSMCENMFFISWNNFLDNKILLKNCCNNFHNFVSLHNVSLFEKLMFKFKLTKFHQNIESIGDGSLIQVMKDLWILGEGSEKEDGIIRDQAQIFSSTSVVIIDVLAREDDGAAGHVLMQIAELWSRNNLLSNLKHVQPREFELINQRRNDVIMEQDLLVLLVLETIHRINVDGLKITPFNDAERRCESTNRWTPLRVFRGSSLSRMSEGTTYLSSGSCRYFVLKIAFSDIQLRGIHVSRQGVPNFRSEMSFLSNIRYRNLVSLIIFYPLKDHIYGSEGLQTLSWKKRLEIFLGASLVGHVPDFVPISFQASHKCTESFSLWWNKYYFNNLIDEPVFRTKLINAFPSLQNKEKKNKVMPRQTTQTSTPVPEPGTDPPIAPCGPAFSK